MKTLDELRNSDYHQQLGQKLWAAFVAQQQGISMNAALKMVDFGVSDLHAPSPGGRPGAAWWAAGPAGRIVVVFAGPVGPTPTTVSAWRPARCLVVLGTAFAIPVNRYSREFETVQSGGPLSTGLSTNAQASTEKLESSRGWERATLRTSMVESVPRFALLRTGETGLNANTAECLGYGKGGNG